MQVILTPTAVPNMFGPGLNGFKGSIPPLPPPTELSAEWFNSVQQEIVNVITGQGLVLDGLQFDQLKQAIDNYVFFDPAISNSLTIMAGATLTVENGGTFQCDLGAIVNFDTPVTFTSDVTLGDGPFDAIIVGGSTTHQSPVFFQDTAEFFDPVFFYNTSSIEGAMTVVGGSGGSLTSDPSALCQWNGTMELNGRIRVLSSTSSAQGDLSRDGAAFNLRWRDAAGTKFVHTSTVGHMRGYGHSSIVGFAATVSLNTATSVAPIVVSDLAVYADCWIARAVAGDAIISLIEVAGLGQIGTNATIRINSTGAANEYDMLVFTRTRASATTTPRTFQLFVDGNGQNVQIRNAKVLVTPTL